MKVGVKDNGNNPQTDSTEIVIMFNPATSQKPFTRYNDLSVKVYPNPAQDKIYIEGEFENAMLYDIRGSIIKSTSEHEIELSEINNGMYLLKIIAHGKIETKKLLIKR